MGAVQQPSRPGRDTAAGEGSGPPHPHPHPASRAPRLHPLAPGDHCPTAPGERVALLRPWPRCPWEAVGSRTCFGVVWVSQSAGESARCPLLPLLEDLIERHHLASLLRFAWFLVSRFAQPKLCSLTFPLFTSGWVYYLCIKQDCNVRITLVAGSPGFRLLESQKVAQVEMLLAEEGGESLWGLWQELPPVKATYCLPLTASPSMVTGLRD